MSLYRVNRVTRGNILLLGFFAQQQKRSQTMNCTFPPCQRILTTARLDDDTPANTTAQNIATQDIAAQHPAQQVGRQRWLHAVAFAAVLLGWGL